VTGHQLVGNYRLTGQRVSTGRSRTTWNECIERIDKGDWASACREIEVEGTKEKGRGRTTWNECVKVDEKNSCVDHGVNPG